MADKWSLRRLLGRKDGDTPVTDAAEKNDPSTKMIELGDFKIDLARRNATLRGQELVLTSGEFDVLVFLAGHRQRLVTPHTMLATSWNANRLRQTEFLRVLMSLRQKLDAAGPDRHYLRTEPWVLYRFDPTSSSAA